MRTGSARTARPSGGGAPAGHPLAPATAGDDLLDLVGLMWQALDAVLRGDAGADRSLAELRDRTERLGGGASRAGTMIRDAGGWVVAAEGRRLRIPDLRGMHYLALLVERPGTGIRALELCGGTRTGGWYELADRRAVDAYRRRLRALDEQVADAADTGDRDRADRLRQERDELSDHLGRVAGLGGRPRTFADPGERARTAVRKAVKRALDAVASADADLAAELSATVTTGSVCRYLPDVDRPRVWTVRR